MSSINTKFNIGDLVYFIEDFLDVDDACEVSDIFESAIDTISSGSIDKIEISNKGITYFVNNKPTKEDEIYTSLKDAYIKVMTVLKTKLDECCKNVNCVLENTVNNFEQCCEEHAIK